MACARCDFYTPKDSSKAQLLEASDNLQRMLASIPLTDWGAPSVPDCGPPVGFIWKGLGVNGRQEKEFHGGVSRRGVPGGCG